jgi:hypothetical protein
LIHFLNASQIDLVVIKAGYWNDLSNELSVNKLGENAFTENLLGNILTDSLIFNDKNLRASDASRVWIAMLVNGELSRISDHIYRIDNINLIPMLILNQMH